MSPRAYDSPDFMNDDARGPKTASLEELEDDRETLIDELKTDPEAFEREIMATLLGAMRNAPKQTERTTAASTAIRYLAVKAKVPQVYGEGFE